MRTDIKFKLVGAVAVATTAAVTLGASPALAENAVTQAVTAGSRTASVADLALTGKAYSHAAQTSAGTMTLTADDSSGTDAGWNVTILTSAFVGSTGQNIAATNFSLSSAAAPTATAGQAVDATGGPKVPTISPVGTLDAARKTVDANVGFGKGSYTQALGVSLAIPAQTLAGTYTGTLTTTIAAAP